MGSSGGLCVLPLQSQLLALAFCLAGCLLVAGRKLVLEKRRKGGRFEGVEGRAAERFLLVYDVLGVAVGAGYFVCAFEGGNQQSQDLQVAPH